jgi:hypothetical protein
MLPGCIGTPACRNAATGADGEQGALVPVDRDRLQPRGHPALSVRADHPVGRGCLGRQLFVALRDQGVGSSGHPGGMSETKTVGTYIRPSWVPWLLTQGPMADVDPEAHLR